MATSDVSVVVPYRDGGCEFRARAFEFVRAHYETHHPDWQIVTGTCDGEWSKGAAVADALTRAEGDVLVLADADVFSATLEVAVSAVSDGAPWGRSHNFVRRLTASATARVLEGETPTERMPLDWPVYRGVTGGGLVAISRGAYERVPIDPRFRGWGGEDVSWGNAATTLLGRPWTGKGVLWHLWHPPQASQPASRRGGVNEQLHQRYVRALRQPRRMDALLAEVRKEPDGCPPC